MYRIPKKKRNKNEEQINNNEQKEKSLHCYGGVVVVVIVAAVTIIYPIFNVFRFFFICLFVWSVCVRGIKTAMMYVHEAKRNGNAS